MEVESRSGAEVKVEVGAGAVAVVLAVAGAGPRSRVVAGGRLDLLGQLRDHLAVDEGVHVVAQHVQQPPVADVRLPRQGLGHLVRDQLVPPVEHLGAQGGHAEQERPVQHQHRQQPRQDHEPEPDEDVRLLVDDVERQQAQRVVLLDRAGRTVLVEDALGDAGEHVHHGVHPLLLVLVRERHDAQAVAEELAVEEVVHHVELADDVDQAQRLAEEVADGVRVVALDVVQQVVDEDLLLLVLIFVGDEPRVEPRRQHPDQASLPGVPQPLRRVAHHGLEKEDEAHPLVVRVVLLGVLVAEVVGDAGVCHLLADLALERVRHGERGRDPAVRVDGVRRQPVDDALDGLADVLRGRDDERA